MTTRNTLFTLVILSASLGTLVQRGISSEAPATDTARATVPLPQLAHQPSDNPTTEEKVALGKLLFFDPRLSGDNSMSCATCHLPHKAFGDGRARAQGFGGRELARNTPTLLNVGFVERFFWDGRASSLEEQVLFPIQAADEMNQNLNELERELSEVPEYVERFDNVFGTKVTRDGIARALAAFERTLITGLSPFDRFLQGDKQALSSEARFGYELFTGAAGCIRCHHGPLLSDARFYRLGVSFEDAGLASVTGRKEDRAKFRTPSLRNVAETGPYMHDGSIETLEQVVEFYYRNAPVTAPDGLVLDIEPLVGQSYTEMAAIVAFLKSLSGEVPKVTPPELP